MNNVMKESIGEWAYSLSVVASSVTTELCDSEGTVKGTGLRPIMMDIICSWNCLSSLRRWSSLSIILSSNLMRFSSISSCLFSLAL